MDTYHLVLVLLILVLISRRASRYSGPSNGPPTKRPTKKGSTPRGVELIQVHPQPGDDTETDVDIIAIHGLDTNSADTWTWKSKPGDQGVNWLSDDNMLPCKVASARIFMCDWPSNLFEHSDYSQKTFDEFARLLLAGIAARPQAANYSEYKERPILFIASCLGGIILMKALVRTSPEYSSVQKAACGIVFLATPFSGTSFRDVAEWALPGLKALAFIRAEKLSNLLYQTKSNSELGQLRRDFTTLCLNRIMIDPLYVTAFYETGKTSLPRKLVPWLPAFLAQEKPLVGEESATLDVIHDPLPLERTHLLMNKFSGPFDKQFNVVTGRIRHILQKIREGRPLEMADAYINNTCYKARNLEIERISGEFLSVERCYVNLAVIKQRGGEDTPQSSKFSPYYSRFKIETLDESIQVNMRRLFGQRKGDDGNTIQCKRILIRGHAGVGKSTLCKKIVHDFKEHDMWRNTFVRILWVPLRNLKRLDKANCNLKAMLHEEYFSQTPKGNEFADELWKELETSKYKKTLFILDGLDEVYEGLERDSYMFNLLETLLNLPTVIVTSRPHVSLTGRLELKFDLELETVGFYPDQVNSYIENVVVMPGEKEPDRQKIDGLRSLLQQHRLLQGLVRIPIQLDALCYIWSDEKSSLRDGPVPETMTGIYQAIVERVWKKDILRLRKKDGGEVIAQADIRDASLKTVETYVSDELYLLERLAFTGMVNDVISFQRRDYIGILHGGNSRILPAKTLPRLSFLRTSNPSSGDPTYHFLHLTFQEYFAARYFVRKWEAGKPLICGKGEPSKEMGKFLAHHKYDARYYIFWGFVAGLLSLEGESINEFFQLIGDEPLDLLGPVHERLVMHCLSEVELDRTAFSVEREKLEYQLGRWLAFECKFTKEPLFAYAMDFPEAPLKAVLESASMKERLILVESLTHRPSMPSSVTRLVCSWLQDNIDAGLRIAIFNVLAQQHGALETDFLGAIVAQLEDESTEVQRLACDILKRWSPLRNDVLNAVMARATDKESFVQPTAISVLGAQPRIDDKITNVLAAQLGDREMIEYKPWLLEGKSFYDEAWSFHNEYREWLNKARPIIRTLLLRLRPREGLPYVISGHDENEHYVVRDTAIQLLENQPDLSENIFRTITAALAYGDDIDVWKVALEVLGSWPQPNDKILDIIKAQLEDQDWRARVSAIRILGKWPELNHKIIDVITMYLRDKRMDVRLEAVRTLIYRPQLSHNIIGAIRTWAQDEHEEETIRDIATKTPMNQQQLDDDIYTIIIPWLGDEYVYVRCAALHILGSRPQLSREIVDMVVARLEDEHWLVREKALVALGNWSQLSDTALGAIAMRLSDPWDRVQEAAAKAFRNRLQPNDNVIEAIATRLKAPSWHTAYGVVEIPLLEAFENWSQLGDTILDAIAMKLSDHDEKVWGATASNRYERVREAAAKAFRNRPQPKDNVIRAIVAQLKAPSSHSVPYGAVEGPLLEALENWSQLEDYVLYAVARLLLTQPWSDPRQIRLVAAQFFQTRPQPNDNIIDAIGQGLEDAHPVAQEAILGAMGNWPQLSDKHLVAIAGHLVDQSPNIQVAAFDALMNQSYLPFALLEPHMEALYKVSLLMSFTEHVYWPTESGQSFMVLGERKVYWKMARDHTEGESKSTPNTGSDLALWLREHVPAWREQCGFSGKAL